MGHILNVATRCYVLLFPKNDVILSRYPTGYKGGHCDRNGRTVTHSKGGSRAHSQETIYRQKILARRGDTCNQDGRWYMAGKGVGCRRPSQKADAQQTRTRPLILGKLTVLSAADRLASPDWNPSEDNRCNVLLPVAIIPDKTDIRQYSGGIERDSPSMQQPTPTTCAHTIPLCGVLYFYALAWARIDALLVRQYALWEREVEA